MVELASAQRAAGHSVDLVCAPAPPTLSPSLAQRAAEAGFESPLALRRARGWHPWRDRGDTAALRSLVEQRGYDVVHAWHTRDHVLALRAIAQRRRAGATRLVRSYKLADPIPRRPWNRWLFGPGCDGLLCVSRAAAEANRRLRGGRPVAWSFGAVDLERFRPGAREPGRAALGLGAEHRVIGIVARAQRHRRFDLLLEAFARFAADCQRARLVVVGRGTHFEETAVAPARRLGLADRVIFAGYRTEDYADVLRSFDVFTFLVPGSDGGCRALLEAHACGLPAVATRRGALPEIVAHGQTGLLVDEEPEALAGAWRELLDDSNRSKLARAARERAEREFSRARLAQRVDALYASLSVASGPPWSSTSSR